MSCSVLLKKFWIDLFILLMFFFFLSFPQYTLFCTLFIFFSVMYSLALSSSNRCTVSRRFRRAMVFPFNQMLIKGKKRLRLPRSQTKGRAGWVRKGREECKTVKMEKGMRNERLIRSLQIEKREDNTCIFFLSLVKIKGPPVDMSSKCSTFHNFVIWPQKISLFCEVN